MGHAKEHVARAIKDHVLVGKAMFAGPEARKLDQPSTAIATAFHRSRTAAAPVP